MQQELLRSNRNKLLQEGMYVIQLNGEQHYVQAAPTVVSAPTTAISLNPAEHLQHGAYLQQHQLEQQIQTIQPQQTTVIHHQADAFQEVLDFIQHLYAELSKEKNLTHYFCLFCAQEYVDLRLLLRHTSDLHSTKILDGSINLEQDFEAIVRKKIQVKEQQSHVNQQLYQCVQCQQMFNSLETISEHLNHCQPTTTTVVQPQSSVESVPSINDNVSYQVKAEPVPTELDSSSNHSQIVNIHDPYIPYGCAQCGRRYHTIRDLMNHMQTCRDDRFYDAANHLQHKNWVEAPKNQHIVIKEETTNVVLKTTGLWLMHEPLDQQSQPNDAVRGFWVMPSSTSDYIDPQILREQQEKERREQQLREQRLLQEQQEKLRIQQEQKRIQEQQLREQQLREQQLREQQLLERQLREQQEKLRIQREEEEKRLIQRQILEQQQLQEQQKQLLLQQHQLRQSQSVVQTIATGTQSVPLSSPTSVISQHNQINSNLQSHRSQSAANTIIVLNDQQIYNHSSTDALRCIQTADGSYQVIGNVDLNERSPASNATSVIAHTSPTAIELTQTSQQVPPRKRRGRNPKQYNTQQQQNDNSQLVVMDNVYQSTVSITPVAQSQSTATSRSTKRKRGAQVIDTSPITIDPNQAVLQNIDPNDVPPQQYYLAYNDNGVLVPIESTASTIVKNEIANQTVVDLSPEQYIIEDLDASRKAKQKNKASRRTGTNSSTTATVATTSYVATASPATNDGATNDLSAYNIDDLSHLDKPIDSEKPVVIPPVKPLKTKPEFMDSFFSFLRNRESNKL